MAFEVCRGWDFCVLVPLVEDGLVREVEGDVEEGS